MERERVSSKVKSEDPILTKTECHIHELYSKKQNPLARFGFSVTKKQTSHSNASATNCTSASNGAASATGSESSGSIAVSTGFSTPTAPQVRVQSCQGIFHKYMSTQMKKGALMSMSKALLLYGHNCAIHTKSDYVFGKIEPYYQVFSKGCTENVECINRKAGSPKAHWSCDSCDVFVKGKHGYKISQIIRARSSNIKRAIVASERSEMTESDYAEMKNFVDHNINSGWSKAEIAFVNKLRTEMKYYDKVKSLKDSEGKAVVVDSFEGRVPSQ